MSHCPSRDRGVEKAHLLDMNSSRKFLAIRIYPHQLHLFRYLKHSLPEWRAHPIDLTLETYMCGLDLS